MVKAPKTPIKVLTHKNGKPKTFYKITSWNENHHGFKYKTGLNILKDEFMPYLECGPGGLYFCDKKDLLYYTNYGVHIREVHIPVDAKVQYLQNKYKADKIILTRKYPLYSRATFRKFFFKDLHPNNLKTSFLSDVFTNYSENQRQMRRIYFNNYFRLTNDSLRDQCEIFNDRSYIVRDLGIVYLYNQNPELLKLLLEKDHFSQSYIESVYYDHKDCDDFNKILKPYIK